MDRVVFFWSWTLLDYLCSVWLPVAGLYGVQYTSKVTRSDSMAICGSITPHSISIWIFLHQYISSESPKVNPLDIAYYQWFCTLFVNIRGYKLISGSKAQIVTNSGFWPTIIYMLVGSRPPLMVYASWWLLWKGTPTFSSYLMIFSGSMAPQILVFTVKCDFLCGGTRSIDYICIYNTPGDHPMQWKCKF